MLLQNLIVFFFADFSSVTNTYHAPSNDLSRLSQAALFQQQLLQQDRLQQSQTADHLLGTNLFGTNMSKFFDFHKNQQQVHHQVLHCYATWLCAMNTYMFFKFKQHFMVNGQASGNSVNGPSNDHLRLATNNRINSQFLDHSSGRVLISICFCLI